MKSLSIKFALMIAIVALAAILAGSLVTAVYREQNSLGTLLPSQGMMVLPTPKEMTEFALSGNDDQSFNLASLHGKWSFLFFGFTHCPDVCPTTLATLASVREKVAAVAGATQPAQFVFISVDPRRDTPAKLWRYVKHFDSSFHGVTGSPAQISNLARQLGAPYEVSSSAPEANDYHVYHTSAVFLVDPLGRYRAVFSAPHDAKTISKRFAVLRVLAEGH